MKKQLKHVSALAEDLKLAAAREAENRLGACNMIAQRLFRRPENRRVRGDDGLTVETWYDRGGRCFVTQCLHDGFTEVYPNEISGDASEAAVAHLWALQALLDQHRKGIWLSTMGEDTGFSSAECERAWKRFGQDYHAAECFLQVCHFLKIGVDATLTNLGLMGQGTIPLVPGVHSHRMPPSIEKALWCCSSCGKSAMHCKCTKA
jgi:hypothetical protein